MDSTYAVGVLGLLIVVLTTKQFSKPLLEILLKLTRPGATVVLLSLVAFVYTRGFRHTALALALLAVYLLSDLWTKYVNSDARRLHLEIGRDQARFDPSTSIDIQFGNGTASFAPPRMISKDVDASPLLIFPPSHETLAELSGQ